MRVCHALVFGLVSASAVYAQTLPQPAACANFASVKTGSDADCDAAIAKEADPAAKSVLLYRRAYMIIDRNDFNTYPKALADLDEAIRLNPANWKALHERAYLYNEYGRWADALKDIDAQIELFPRAFDGYQERAMSRFNLGDLQGSYEDRDTVVLLRPGVAAPLIGRAAARMWLGEFDAARADLDAAAAIAQRAGDKQTEQDIAAERAELTLLTKTSGATHPGKVCEDAFNASDFSREGLIGDCTLAFLQAKTPKDKADILTFRATARLIIAQDENAAIPDRKIAAALVPEDPDMLANLGFSYVAVHHSRAAIEEFDRSIALKEEFFNYAGRASAKLNLNDIDGAFFDAKKSFEIKPNELALTVLGDCIYARTKSYDEAKDYWIGAYKLGDRDDGLIARLKDAGVPIPPPDPETPPKR